MVCGDVVLGEEASVWHGAVVRGDDAPIRVGARTNVQDLVVVHVDPDRKNVIGEDVTIGHGAICHGVRIGNLALIGMGATLLGGSVIGEGAVVGAGAVVSENMEVPPWSLAVGVPARIVKTFEKEARRRHALETSAHYVRRAREHTAGEWEGKVVLP